MHLLRYTHLHITIQAYIIPLGNLSPAHQLFVGITKRWTGLENGNDNRMETLTAFLEAH